MYGLSLSVGVAWVFYLYPPHLPPFQFFIWQVERQTVLVSPLRFNNSRPYPAMDSIIDKEVISQWLGLQTESARDSLGRQLSTWTSHPATLQHWSKQASHLQSTFATHPAVYDTCREHFRGMAECEKSMTALWDSSELERKTYGELLFLSPLTQPLNSIPFFLTGWTLLRMYLLPGMSLLLPLLSLLLPYLILTYVLCLPITFSNYFTLLQSIVSGTMDCQMTSLPTDAAPVPPSMRLKQVVVMGMTILQGFFQPYWTYKHLHTIDSTMRDHGQDILAFKEHYDALRDLLSEHGIPLHPCPIPSLLDKRHAVSQVLLHPMYFRLALRYVGSIEVRIQLCRQSEVSPVQWVSSSTPVFRIQNAVDIHVPRPLRKPFDLDLHDRRHALLTGPNKGGKSTVLRALSFSTLLAHTYGCSVGTLEASPLDRLLVCLKPDDLPGSKSRFEREIEFTAHTLTYDKPIMVLLDELYHSTNPPDALFSCRQYSERLWKMPQCISVISTHLFEWVEEADPSIQRICCPAYYDDNQQLHFTYELQEGVSRVSSVHELLKKNGLCA